MDAANDGLSVVSGFATVKFLDLWCYMSWHKYNLPLVHKKDIFSFSGPVSLKSKNRYPIPLGDRQALARRLRSDFKARIARYRQMSFSRDVINLHLLLEMAALVRLGYSTYLIETSWLNACTDSNFVQVGVAALKGIQASIKPSGKTHHIASRSWAGGAGLTAMPPVFDLTDYFASGSQSANSEALMAEHTLERMQVAAQKIVGTKSSQAPMTQADFDRLLMQSIAFRRIEEEIGGVRDGIGRIMDDVRTMSCACVNYCVCA